MAEKEILAQGCLAGCLSCAIDALNRSAEIADKLQDGKLRYEIQQAIKKVNSLEPLIERIGA